MAEKLEVIITAEDRASKVFSRMGGLLKNTFAIGLGIATAATGALAAGLAFSVKEAMESQEVQSQLAAVIESTGGAAGVTADMANKLGEQLSTVTRFSDEAIVSAENMLLTFTNIGADVFPMATEAVLNIATAMGTDAKGAAIQIGKALNDPIKGITALTRVGVTFSEEQKKVIASLMKTGDTAGAQKIILAELEKEFGNSARAAGTTLAGQLDILKNAFGNVAEGVGTAVIPILTGFLTNVITPILPAVQKFATFLGDLITALFNTGLQGEGVKTVLMNMFGEETTGKIMAVVDGFVNLSTTISDFVNNTVIPFVTEHGETIKNILLAIVAGFGAFAIISTVVGWITGLIGVITGLATAITAAGGGIAGIVALLGGPLVIIIALVAGAIALLAVAWKNDWGGIQEKLSTFWNETAKPVLETLREWLAVNIPIAIDKLKSFWEDTLLPALKRFWSWVETTVFPLIETLWNWIQDNLPIAIAKLSDFWTNTLQPAIQDVWDFVETTVFPIIEDLWAWIQDTIPVALEALAGFWEDTLYPAIEMVWAFVQDNLVPLFETLGELLEVTLGTALTILTGLWENVLYPALEDIWDFISTNLKPIFEDITEFIQSTFGPAIEGVAGGTGPLGILKSILDGIGGAIQSVIGFLQSLIEKLRNLNLPDWATPGSPTPFEIGLRGIADALNSIVSASLPQFQAQLDATGSSMGRMIQSSVTHSTEINLTAQYQYQPYEDVARSVRTLAMLYGVS